MAIGMGVPGKTRAEKRDYINSHGLGKKVYDFHENVAKPAFKRNKEFIKGVFTKSPKDEALTKRRGRGSM